MNTLKAAFCGVSLPLVCVLVCGQTPVQRPVFEVASVKPDPSLSLRHVLLPPVGGRLSTRGASLRLLIQNAYGVQSFEISAGPDWMNSARFVIEAKAEGNPTEVRYG